MNLLQAFTNEQLKSELPVVNVGDTIRIHNRIKEGARERIQMFEGTVIAKHGGGISETFTVRRVSYGCGIEKILHSNRGVATREGLYDWELLYMLGQKDPAAALAISRSVARTFEDFTDDAAVIDAARARLLEAVCE